MHDKQDFVVALELKYHLQVHIYKRQSKVRESMENSKIIKI